MANSKVEVSNVREGGILSRSLRLVAAAFDRRLRDERDLYLKRGDQNAGSELEHRLSWRFGVPVR